MNKKEAAFSLVELLIVVWILAFVMTAMIQLFIYTSVEAEMAGNKTLAVSEAQNKIEEIRNSNYANIVTNYSSGGTPGNIFTPTSFTGKGVVYLDTNGSFINSTSSELIGIKVVVCWRNKYGRVVGEDTNLNGQKDAGEDLNGNNQLDSPVVLMSMITRR